MLCAVARQNRDTGRGVAYAPLLKFASRKESAKVPKRPELLRLPVTPQSNWRSEAKQLEYPRDYPDRAARRPKCLYFGKAHLLAVSKECGPSLVFKQELNEKD